MDEHAKWSLKNVVVLARADGDVCEQEERFIESLRVKLGIDEREFRKLCDEVQRQPHKMSMPRDPAEASQRLRLLAELAQVDGVLAEKELELLRKLARHSNVSEYELEALLNTSAEADDAALADKSEQLYQNFQQWDSARRKQGVAAFVEFGRVGVVGLLRIMESYRNPEGMDDALELKTLVAEQLGELADTRAVYYLIQQVNLSDTEDEVTNSRFRAAAAEAVGRITGRTFSPDDQGIADARQWWLDEGRQQYDKLLI